MNKKIVHDALILTAFTLVLGLLVGCVYGITKAPREAAEKATKEAAYKAVFEDADSFKTYEPFEKDVAKAQADAAKVLGDKYSADEILDVQEALDGSGNTAGYVITVNAKDGSQGAITFSVGIKSDGTVNGYSITKTGETPGLGLKASEPDFYKQFQDKLVEEFTVVKQAPSADNEIEAITGSTITSKAMANGCNAAILYFKSISGGAK